MVRQVKENRDEQIGLFSEFADDHAVSVYGEPSPELVEMAERMPEGSVRWYSFLQGLES